MYNLSRMYELRNWYVQNSPHSTYSEKYSHEMSVLHNEINYLNSKQLLTRLLLTGAVVLGYIFFILEEPAKDYKDQFDLKFNLKAYGSTADGSG